MSTQDRGEVYAEYAWPRWASFLKSRHPEGDLTLTQLAAVVPAYSRRRAEQRKNQRSIIHSHDFPRYSRRQLPRLAEDGKIPGAYRTKGGQWRVRPGEALCRWLAAGGLSPKPDVAERKLMDRDKDIERVLALGTRSGLDGAFQKDPDPLWRTSLARLAQAEAMANAVVERCGVRLAKSEDLTDEERKNLMDEKCRADLIKQLATLVKSPAGLPKDKKVQLEIAVALGEMTAAGEKITLTALALKLGITRHTLNLRLPVEFRTLLIDEPSKQIEQLVDIKKSVHARKRTAHSGGGERHASDAFGDSGLTD